MSLEVIEVHMTKIRGLSLITLLGLLAFTAGFSVRTTDQKSGSSGQDSEILKRMFQEDQADRNAGNSEMTDQERSEWRKRLRARDDQRHKEAVDLIKRGELHTGADFEEASVIFQHGLDPDDICSRIRWRWSLSPRAEASHDGS